MSVAPAVFSSSLSAINHDMYIALGGQSGMIVTPLEGCLLICCGQIERWWPLPGKHMEGALNNIKCFVKHYNFGKHFN